MTSVSLEVRSGDIRELREFCSLVGSSLMYKSVRSKTLIGSSMNHENLIFFYFVRTTFYDLCLKWLGWLGNGVEMGVLFQSSSLISHGLSRVSYPGSPMILDVRICLDAYSR